LAAADLELGVINTYYSHVSRLFVSTYATFFVVYVGFLALLYNARFSHFDALTRCYVFLASFAFTGLEILLLYRGWHFGMVLNQIDHHWVNAGIPDVTIRFFPLGPWPKRLGTVYVKWSVPTALVLTFCMPILCYILLWT
jgi:hypothetical protein